MSGPQATHRKHSYIPDYKFDEKQIAKIYHKSDKSEVYLGDWHSHPKADSYLSFTDKATLEKISKFQQARLAKPLMLVLGTRPFKITIWQYSDETIRELSLHLF